MAILATLVLGFGAVLAVQWRRSQRDQALLEAVRHGDAVRAREALSLGADPNSAGRLDRDDPVATRIAWFDTDPGEASAGKGAPALPGTRSMLPGSDERPPQPVLSLAAAKGSVPMVAALLEHGARANAGDRCGSTALMYAGAGGAPPQVAELLISHGAEVDIVNGAGLTPAWAAASVRNWPFLLCLLQHGAHSRVSGSRPRGHLLTAVLNGEGPIRLPGRLACAEALFERADYSPTVDLLNAAARGKTDLVGLIADHCRDPNALSAALGSASAGGREDAVRLLLRRGADPTRQVGHLGRRTPAQVAPTPALRRLLRSAEDAWRRGRRKR